MFCIRYKYVIFHHYVPFIIREEGGLPKLVLENYILTNNILCTQLIPLTHLTLTYIPHPCPTIPMQRVTTFSLA